MALTPEELQVLQRIDKQLNDIPFYVVEYIRSKKRAGLSAVPVSVPALRPAAAHKRSAPSS